MLAGSERTSICTGFHKKINSARKKLKTHFTESSALNFTFAAPFQLIYEITGRIVFLSSVIQT